MNPIELTESLVVVAICGSLRPGSYTRQALAIALRGAQEIGAETRLIDLRDYRLAYCGLEDETANPEGVSRLRREVGRGRGSSSGRPSITGGTVGS